MGAHCFYRVLDTVNHDVDQDTRIPSRFTSGHPRAAHLPDRVVERGVPISPCSELPPENVSVKGGRFIDVNGRDLQVADFAVAIGGVLFVFHDVPRLSSVMMIYRSKDEAPLTDSSISSREVRINTRLSLIEIRSTSLCSKLPEALSSDQDCLLRLNEFSRRHTIEVHAACFTVCFPCCGIHSGLFILINKGFHRLAQQIENL